MLTCSFPIWIPFISLFCNISWARNSRTILKKSGPSCHMTEVRGNEFSFCSFTMICVLFGFIEVYTHIFFHLPFLSSLFWVHNLRFYSFHYHSDPLLCYHWLFKWHISLLFNTLYASTLRFAHLLSILWCFSHLTSFPWIILYVWQDWVGASLMWVLT
jgi:hypothetical protein